MEEKEAFKERLRELFAGQQLAVLATHNQGQPYTSLVAFAVTEGLDLLVFATTRSTRKYANLSADPRVAMLIDSRSNRVSDISRSMAATATGHAGETAPEQRDTLLDLYLTKHPHMKEFVASPSCALMRVEVDTYYVVSQFQKVFELRIKP